MAARSGAKPANPPTRVAEKRRDASEPSMMSFMEEHRIPAALDQCSGFHAESAARGLSPSRSPQHDAQYPAWVLKDWGRRCEEGHQCPDRPGSLML